MKNSFQSTNKSGIIRGSLVPVLAVALFAIFILITIVNTFITSKEYTAEIIERDINTLAAIFKRIEKECRILKFEQQKNVINFLNVGSFVGSQVGPINLKYPTKWQGPYLADNPTIKGKEYMVVRTKKGYFVTPGENVKLPNGKTIGIDIKLDESSDIGAMIKDDTMLRYKGKPLAAPLEIKKRGTFFQALPSDMATI